jgi:hypothetical protein
MAYQMPTTTLKLVIEFVTTDKKIIVSQDLGW